MSFADDTDDLLQDPNSGHGEAVVIRRNTPTYGDTGAASDSFSTIATIQGDIQPNSASNPTVELGQQKMSSHRIFLPNGANVLQGDRVRPSGWSAGEDEYEVDGVLSEEGHVEALASLVKGHG